MTSLCPLLTDDLMIEILIRLPVKPLLRCKSVSKPWLSLISSPSFIKSHLTFAKKAAANDTLIVQYEDDTDDNSISLIDLTSLRPIAHLNFPKTDEAYVLQGDVSDLSIAHINADSRLILTQLHIPIPDNQSESMSESLIIGSASGIVCVRSTTDDIYIWNPATRQAKLVPSPMLDDCGVFRTSLGFGFDEIDNDFKIVRIVSSVLHSEVYSVNSNVWRLVDVKPIDIPCLNNDFEVCVNGFLCSVGSRHGMMTFDLNKEVFNCGINLPNTTFGTTFTDIKDCTAYARITDFNDSVAVIIYKSNEDGCKINLWMLDDEAFFRGGGIQASWTLMVNIDIDLPIVFIHGYFKNGDLLLLNDDVDWCLYNSVTENFRDFSDSFRTGQIFEYTESLVSIPGSKSVVVQTDHLERS